MKKILILSSICISILFSAEQKINNDITNNVMEETKEKIDNDIRFTDVIKRIEEIYQEEKLRILKEEQEIRKKTKQITEEKKRIISEAELIKAKIEHQKLLKQLNSLSKEMLDSSLENDQKENDLRLKIKLLQLEKDKKTLNNDVQKEKLENEEKLIKMNKLKQEMEKSKKELELKEQKAKITEQENKVKIEELKQKLILKQQEMEIKKQEALMKKEQEELKKVSMQNENRKFEMEIKQQSLNYKLRMLLMAMNMENIKRAFFPITFTMEQTHFDGTMMIGNEKVYIISDKKLSEILNKKLEKREKDLSLAKEFLAASQIQEEGSNTMTINTEDNTQVSESEKIISTNKDLYIKDGFEYEDFTFTILPNKKMLVEQKDYYIDIRKNILGDIKID